MLQTSMFGSQQYWPCASNKLEDHCQLEFPYPNPYVQHRKRPMPRLLKAFPLSKHDNVALSLRKLATLTIEEVHKFIISVLLIPKLTVEWNLQARQGK